MKSAKDLTFGTDGWRDVISDGFTFANVRIVAQAIAEYLLKQARNEVQIPLECGGRPENPLSVVVGYDTRFLSERYAREIACVLAGNGLSVHLTSSFCTSPVLSFSVKMLRAGGGVMVTASHNPPEYNGIKFKGYYGGSALPVMSSEIERIARENSRLEKEPEFLPFKEAVSTNRIFLFDPRPDYLADISRILDVEALKNLKGRIVFDPMFGAASGLVEAFFSRHKITSVQVDIIRGDRNPWFGGVNPEPIRKNLDALVDRVQSSGARAGFAFDGDADRAGAVDEKGNFVDSHRLFGLILVHLCRNRGWRGAVAKTFSTTMMVNKIAASCGLEVIETPIGFRHICNLMVGGDVLIGGEESGGIGIKNHIPERDGVLTSLLVLEMMGRTGKSLSALVEDLLSEFGPHYYEREDVNIDGIKMTDVREALRRAFGALKESSAARKGFGQNSIPISDIKDLDGYKILFNDSSWILFRPSGTEPVLRVYAEASTPEEVKNLLSDGRAFLESILPKG
ncbi:MAG TPA: phosphoglucomutase/phosphomannomutase family protein [Clostridia bacterium]|nr:phosphoglucomutase/phosphomannomutase family protein [Clostridia bacterium]